MPSAAAWIGGAGRRAHVAAGVEPVDAAGSGGSRMPNCEPILYAGDRVGDLDVAGHPVRLVGLEVGEELRDAVRRPVHRR